jgi:hypothetical protein
MSPVGAQASSTVQTSNLDADLIMATPTESCNYDSGAGCDNGNSTSHHYGTSFLDVPATSFASHHHSSPTHTTDYSTPSQSTSNPVSSYSY